MIDYNFRHDTSVRYLGGGAKPKLPPAPDPVPTAADIDIEAQRRADDVRRKLKSKKGRRGTILVPSEEGQGVLGVGNVEEKRSILGG